MRKFAVLVGLLLPLIVHAQIDPCPLGELACPGGFADRYFAGILASGAKWVFGGILVAMMVFYGFRLVMGSYNESTVTEVYNSYGYAALGTVLAGGAFYLANTFAVPGQLVNSTPGNTVIFNAINVFRALLFAALVFNIFYQGYRLATEQDESQNEKAKKQFIYGMVGAVIVILADRFVYAVSGVQYGIISTELIGVANFLGTIFGAFAVIALFVAGLWLVFAVDEQNAEKAKKIIITTFIVLGIAMVSLALIRLTVRAPFTT